MNVRWFCALLAATHLAAGTASADVRRSAPDGFEIEHRFELRTSPEAAWRALIGPGRWWPSDHTWSGDAANLSLDADAGGCFCERWPQGAVEHARVVMARPGQLLRLRGSLGPMQEMAVTGILTIALIGRDSGTEAVVTYRVSGDPSHALDKLAPVVDEVLGLQFGNFAAYAGRASAE